MSNYIIAAFVLDSGFAGSTEWERERKWDFRNSFLVTSNAVGKDSWTRFHVLNLYGRRRKRHNSRVLSSGIFPL